VTPPNAAGAHVCSLERSGAQLTGLYGTIAWASFELPLRSLLLSTALQT
jgi:hypothetical protein